MFNYFKKFFQKVLLDVAYTKNSLAIEKNLKTTRDIRELLVTKQSQKIEGLDNIINVNHYFALFSNDISIILKHLLLSADREKNIFARILALMILEMLNDINKLFQKKFRLIVENLVDETQVQKLDLVLKKFHLYKKNNFSKLKEIRINTIGHREIDAKEQDSKIDKIEIDKIIKLTNEITILSTQLNDWTTNFLKKLLKKLTEECISES